MQVEENNVEVSTIGSIQEPEKNIKVADSDPNSEVKFKLTLEPTMMLLLLGVNVSSELYLCLTEIHSVLMF